MTTLKVLPILASSPVVAFPVKTILTYPKSFVSEIFTELNILNSKVPAVFELSVLNTVSPSNEPSPSV